MQFSSLKYIFLLLSAPDPSITDLLKKQTNKQPLGLSLAISVSLESLPKPPYGPVHILIIHRLTSIKRFALNKPKI